MATVRVTVRQTVVFIEVFEVEVEGEVTADSITEAAEDGWPDPVERISSNVIDEEVYPGWVVLTDGGSEEVADG